jgi:hypothetical protein
VSPAPPDTIPESGVLWRTNRSNEAVAARLMQPATHHLLETLRSDFS